MSSVNQADWKEKLHIQYSPTRLPHAEGFLAVLPELLVTNNKGLTLSQCTVTAEPFATGSEGELAKDAVHIRWRGEVAGNFQPHISGRQGPIDKHLYAEGCTVRGETGEQAILLFQLSRWRAIAGIYKDMDLVFDHLISATILALSEKPAAVVKAVEHYLYVHRLLVRAIPVIK